MPIARKRPTAAEIEEFAGAADAPTHAKPAKKAPKATKPAKKSRMTRTTVSIDEDLLGALEDRARANKRKGLEDDSVSALCRSALTRYLAP